MTPLDIMTDTRLQDISRCMAEMERCRESMVIHPEDIMGIALGYKDWYEELRSLLYE